MQNYFVTKFSMFNSKLFLTILKMVIYFQFTPHVQLFTDIMSTDSTQ